MWKQEQKAFPRGVLIGIGLMFLTTVTLGSVPNPDNIKWTAIGIAIAAVLVSAALYPLKIYRKLKGNAYRKTLIESTAWTFTAFQILFVFMGNKPLWSLVLPG